MFKTYEGTGGNKTVERTPVVLFNDTECHVFSSGKRAAQFARVTPALISLRKRVASQREVKFPYSVSNLDDFLAGV